MCRCAKVFFVDMPFGFNIFDKRGGYELNLKYPFGSLETKLTQVPCFKLNLKKLHKYTCNNGDI